MEFTVKAQLAAREEVLSFVAAACHLVGPARTVDLSDPFDAEIMTAFSELFNNIVKHAYAGSGDGTIDISVEVSGDQIFISTIDVGVPFDVDTVKQPDMEDLPEMGLGLYIARSCVDELEYQPGPPNQWTITKRYPSLVDRLAQPESPTGANS